MSKKHADALVAKSGEIPALAGKVFLTEAKYPTPNETERVDAPYLVWHPANGVNVQDRVTAPRSTKHPTFTGHLVGESAAQVLLLMDDLEAKLFPDGKGIRIDVPGERGRPLNFSCPLPVQKQTDPQPTVIYGVVEVDWLSDPA